MIIYKVLSLSKSSQRNDGLVYDFSACAILLYIGHLSVLNVFLLRDCSI